MVHRQTACMGAPSSDVTELLPDAADQLTSSSQQRVWAVVRISWPSVDVAICPSVNLTCYDRAADLPLLCGLLPLPAGSNNADHNQYIQLEQHPNSEYVSIHSPVSFLGGSLTRSVCKIFPSSSLPLNALDVRAIFNSRHLRANIQHFRSCKMKTRRRNAFV